MMVKKKGTKVKPGDIVGIPLEEKRVAVGMVLHVSTLFKNAIMIGFYNQLFESMEDIDIEALGGEFIETPNYTGKQLITSGRWEVVGNNPKLLAEAAIPQLRVVNTLHYKDQVIRQLSPDEFKEYVEFRGQGGIFVENKLRKHFAGK